MTQIAHVHIRYRRYTSQFPFGGDVSTLLPMRSIDALTKPTLIFKSDYCFGVLAAEIAASIVGLCASGTRERVSFLNCCASVSLPCFFMAMHAIIYASQRAASSS